MSARKPMRALAPLQINKYSVCFLICISMDSILHKPTGWELRNNPPHTFVLDVVRDLYRELARTNYPLPAAVLVPAESPPSVLLKWTNPELTMRVSALRALIVYMPFEYVRGNGTSESRTHVFASDHAYNEAMQLFQQIHGWLHQMF